MKYITMIIAAMALQGCLEIKTEKSDVIAFTPMQCERYDNGYAVKWTSMDSVKEVSSSKAVIINEIDGKIVTITDESDWLCEALGDEVTLK